MYHFPEADFNTKSSVNECAIDEQTIAQVELNAYIANLAQIIAPEIEIDSDIDSTLGTLYRVWSSYHLLGTFYQAIDGESSAVLGSPQVKQLANPKGSWVVQSSYCSNHIQCNTETEAQLLIVAISGLLVASSIEEADIDQLLDKPFDELTLSDWERLKQHAIRAELMAA